MPPPIPQRESRAGLITAVVILSILFVTATVLLISVNADKDRAIQDREANAKQLADVASPQELAALPALRSAADADPALKGMTPLGAQIALTARMATTIAGTRQADEAQAQAEQAKAMAAAVVAGGSTTQPAAVAAADTTLVNVIRSLAGRIEALQSDVDRLTGEVKTAQGETEEVRGERKAMLDEHQKQVDALKAASDKMMQEIKQYQSQRTTQVTQIEQSAQQEIKAAQKSFAQVQAEMSKLEETIKKQTQDIVNLQNKLGEKRVPTKVQIVRQPDGQVVRAAGNGRCFINLGLGDQVPQGMTFEVYDRTTGIPPLGDGMAAGDLPAGKGSIEVVTAEQGRSECRIVRQEPGQTISEGDLIMNLVYDKNTRYNFVVYGDFDLDNDTRVSPGDTEIIRRLVTQWGGRVQEAVNANTDFVVMGTEPEVPVLSDDERATPEGLNREARAKAELENYLQVLDRASDLNIPVLNQNRFLYFVGYYDQATR